MHLPTPSPEIAYKDAMMSREDIIMATGRSDHPNQVNNVLGFPYIFRGALDVRATAINEAMKLAAVKAIADLAKEQVPDMVNKAYGDKNIQFGRDYLIPKPLDTRLITSISPAVAKAAMDSGVAKSKITDWGQYHYDLQKRIGIDQKLISRIISRAKKDPKVVVFAEANNHKILKAAQVLQDEKIAKPILLGKKKDILKLIEEHNLELNECILIDTYEEQERIERYAQKYYEARKRKGMTMYEALKQMRERNTFGAMMVEHGEADALISGLTKDYPKTILPALQVIGVNEGVKRVAGMYAIFSTKGTLFFADTTVNVDPNAEELADIIAMTKKGVEFFDVEPRMAVLSYSNFGSSKGDIPQKTKKAVELAKKRFPDLVIEGDIQANVALNTEIQQDMYPFSNLADKGSKYFHFSKSSIRKH